MNVKAIYENSESNYEEALSRFSTENRIAKFLDMFAKDDTLEKLGDAIYAEDWETVFRCVHTLKGLYMNLSFTKLAAQASVLTEEVRGGIELVNMPLYNEMCQNHLALVKAINTEIK